MNKNYKIILISAAELGDAKHTDNAKLFVAANTILNVNSGDNVAFGNSSIRSQEAMLEKFRQQPASAIRDVIIEMAEGMLASAKDADIFYGQTRGLYEVSPLSFDDSLDDQLRMRTEQQLLLQDQLGITGISLFTDEEKRLIVDNVEEHPRMLVEFIQGLGGSAVETLEELGVENAIIGVAGNLYLDGKLAIGDSLFVGQKIVKELSEDVAFTDLTENAQELISGAYGLNSEHEAAVRDAVMARAAYLAQLNGTSLTDIDDYYEQALEDVAPPIVILDSDEVSDYKITSPNPNWSHDEAQDKTEEWIDSLDITDFPGLDKDLAERVIDNIDTFGDYGFSEFKLVPVDGGYRLWQTFPAGFIAQEDGSDFILTYREKEEAVVVVEKTEVENAATVLLNLADENTGVITETVEGVNEHVYTNDFINTVEAFGGVSDDQAFAAIDAIIAESESAKALRIAAESKGEITEADAGVNEHIYTNDFINTVEAFNGVSDEDAFNAIEAIIAETEDTATVKAIKTIQREVEIGRDLNKDTSGVFATVVDILASAVPDVVKEVIANVVTPEDNLKNENAMTAIEPYQEFDTFEQWEKYQKELVTIQSQTGVIPSVDISNAQADIILQDTPRLKDLLSDENGALTTTEKKLISIVPASVLAAEEQKLEDSHLDVNEEKFNKETFVSTIVDTTKNILMSVSDFFIKPVHGDYIEEAQITVDDMVESFREDSKSLDIGDFVDESDNPLGATVTKEIDTLEAAIVDAKNKDYKSRKQNANKRTKSKEWTNTITSHFVNGRYEANPQIGLDGFRYITKGLDLKEGSILAQIAEKSAIVRSRKIGFAEAAEINAEYKVSAEVGAGGSEIDLSRAGEGKKSIAPITNYQVENTTNSVRDVLDFVPIIGDALVAKDVVNELNQDEVDWQKVGLHTGVFIVGLVPLVGDAAGKLLKKGAKEMTENTIKVGKAETKAEIAAHELAKQNGGAVPVGANGMVTPAGEVLVKRNVLGSINTTGSIAATQSKKKGFAEAASVTAKATVKTARGNTRSKTAEGLVDDVVKASQTEVTVAPGLTVRQLKKKNGKQSSAQKRSHISKKK